jgi:hypothetical protein
VGGPRNGYKYLADSNLDWGQDLKGLSIYLRGNNISEVKLQLLGTAPPEYYGIKYTNLTCEPTTGILAISATNLQSVHDWKGNHTCYNWIKNYEPIKIIGYSIFVYDITKIN